VPTNSKKRIYNSLIKLLTAAVFQALALGLTAPRSSAAEMTQVQAGYGGIAFLFLAGALLLRPGQKESDESGRLKLLASNSSVVPTLCSRLSAPRTHKAANARRGRYRNRSAIMLLEVIRKFDVGP